jgi:hypothetical protein
LAFLCAAARAKRKQHASSSFQAPGGHHARSDRRPVASGSGLVPASRSGAGPVREQRGQPGQLGTESIQVFNGTTGASKGALTLGRDFTGLAFGPDGNLYANRNSGQTAYNPVTGAVVRSTIRQWGTGPDLRPGRQSVFRQFGQVVRSTVSEAPAPRHSGGNLANTRGLTFGPDGNLYVAETSFFNIQRFNGTTGAFLNNFVTNVTPYGLTFGLDGSLFVSTGSNNSVLASTGPRARCWAPSSLRQRRAERRAGPGVRPDGNLYVASFQTDSVLRYNGTTGRFIDVFASGGGLDQPTYLTFGRPRTVATTRPRPVVAPSFPNRARLRCSPRACSPWPACCVAAAKPCPPDLNRATTDKAQRHIRSPPPCSGLPGRAALFLARQQRFHL